MSETAGKARRWPVVIVSILCLHAAGMVGVILVATRDPSFAVEPNHYQKALAWDAFAARAHASQALGWKASARSEGTADANGTRELDLRIVDRDGQAVTGATTAVLAFPHARGEQRSRIDLRESSPGNYRARAPMGREGIWELRLSARRGSDFFATTILHTVGATP